MKIMVNKSWLNSFCLNFRVTEIKSKKKLKHGLVQDGKYFNDRKTVGKLMEIMSTLSSLFLLQLCCLILSGLQEDSEA